MAGTVRGDNTDTYVDDVDKIYAASGVWGTGWNDMAATVNFNYNSATHKAHNETITGTWTHSGTTIHTAKILMSNNNTINPQNIERIGVLWGIETPIPDTVFNTDYDAARLTAEYIILAPPSTTRGGIRDLYVYVENNHATDDITSIEFRISTDGGTTWTLAATSGTIASGSSWDFDLMGEDYISDDYGDEIRFQFDVSTPSGTLDAHSDIYYSMATDGDGKYAKVIDMTKLD